MPKRKTTPSPKLTTFVLRSVLGKEVTVEATDENDARCKAMISLYGKAADRVIPHAPDYKGSGLTLVSYA